MEFNRDESNRIKLNQIAMNPSGSSSTSSGDRKRLVRGVAHTQRTRYFRSVEKSTAEKAETWDLI